MSDLSRRRLAAFVGEVDGAVERWMTLRRTGPLNGAAHVISSAADQAKLTVGVSLLRWTCDRRDGRRVAARTIAGVLITTAAVDVIKGGVNRPRPVNDVELRFRVRPQTSASFPSGHAVSAAMLAVSVSQGRPHWRLPLTALAAAVAWSRVQVGLHHTSDVVAGLALGTATGFALRALVPLRRKRLTGK